MKSRDQHLVSSLANGFELKQWLKAEADIRQKPIPQPKGSLTVEQFAELRGLSPSRSQSILGRLCTHGKARSERWVNGLNGCRKVYWLVK